MFPVSIKNIGTVGFILESKECGKGFLRGNRGSEALSLKSAGGWNEGFLTPERRTEEKKPDGFEEAEEQKGKDKEMGCLGKNLAERHEGISPEWTHKPSLPYKKGYADPKLRRNSLTASLKMPRGLATKPVPPRPAKPLPNDGFRFHLRLRLFLGAFLAFPLKTSNSWPTALSRWVL